MAVLIEPSRIAPPSAIEDVDDLRAMLGAEHSKGAELVVAALIAAKQGGRELTSEEVSLLQWVHLAQLNAHAPSTMSCTEQELHERGRPMMRAAAALEYKRWKAGERTPAERAVFRSMQARVAIREAQERRTAMSHDAKRCAAAEHMAAVERWQKQQRQKEEVRKWRLEKAAEEARLLSEDEARAFRLGTEALLGRVKRGHALSGEELELLRGLRLISRVKGGHALSELECVELKRLQETWQATMDDAMRLRLQGYSKRQEKASGRYRAAPPEEPSALAAARWHQVS